MFKLLISTFAVCLILNNALFAASNSYQPFNPTPTSKSTMVGENSSAHTIMVPNNQTAQAQSPKDFTSGVNKAFQQNQSQMQQEIQQQKQEFVKNLQQNQMNQIKNTPRPSNTPSTDSSSTSTISPTPTVDQSIQEIQATPQPSPQQTQQEAMPQSQVRPTNSSTNQPYTGFGNSGGAKNSKNTGSQKSGGGWNIQY